jgi:hypothetical protein
MPDFLIGVFIGIILFSLAKEQGHAGPHPYHDDKGAVNWRPSLASAFQESRATGKPIFLEATRDNETHSANFAAVTFPHPDVRRLLRRDFVCVSIDRDALPPQYDRFIKSKSISTVPVSLFLTPYGDVVVVRQDDPGPADVLPILKKVLTDPRFSMAKNKETEVNHQVELLAEALKAKDGKGIQAAWNSIQKTPGLCPSKMKAGDLLDEAEEPARKKIDEAAKLVREEKYSLARIALEEANQAGGSLPIESEIKQTLETVPLLESATNIEGAKGDKWKQKAANEYQHILQKYPDTVLATWTQIRLRNLLKKK